MPYDPYLSEEQNIQQQRRYAEMLRQQALDVPQTQMVGRVATPLSWTQGLAQGLKGYLGGSGMRAADEKQRALGEKMANDRAQAFAEALKLGSGTPAQPAMSSPGAEIMGSGPDVPEQPAVPGNWTAAMARLASSPDPMQAAAGTQGVLAEMQRQMRLRAFQDAGGGGQVPPQQGTPLPVAPTTPGTGATPITPNIPQTPTAPAGAAFGGPAGGVPMAVWLASDPTGKSYTEQLAKDFMEGRKPVVNRGYGVGTMVNGKYVPDEASVNQAKTMEEQKARIEAGYKTVPVTNASGATVPTPLLTIPKIGPNPDVTPEQSPVPLQPVTPAPQSPQAPLSNFPRESPTDRSAARDRSLAILKKEAADQIATNGSVDPELQREIDRTQGTSPTTQPSASATDPWATMPKLQQPTGAGQTTYQHTIQVGQGNAAHALSEKYGALAQTANDRKAINAQALSLVDSADTGPMAARIGDVKNWLVSRVGIPESSFANTPSATIALQKDLVNAATQKAKQQFGARITQSEVMLMLTRGAPNVDMTKAAMKYLIQSDIATSDYQIQQANDLGKYLSLGGDPMRFEGWYSQAFPLSKSLAQIHLNSVKGQSQSQRIPEQDRAEELVRHYLGKP